MNRKNKNVFELAADRPLLKQIADFAQMLNTTEKVDLVRCIAVGEPKDKKDLVLKTFGEKVVFIHYFNLWNALNEKVEKASGVRPAEAKSIDFALDALAAPLGTLERADLAVETIMNFFCRHYEQIPACSLSMSVHAKVAFALNALEDAVNGLIEAGKVEAGK